MPQSAGFGTPINHSPVPINTPKPALIAVWMFPPWTVVIASALLGAIAGALR